MYVANKITGDVAVIDAINDTAIKRVPVGDQPEWLTVTPDGKHVYVSNTFSGTVSVIETGTDTVIRTITVGSDPRGIGALPDGSEVFVVNSGFPSSLSVINTRTFRLPLPH